MTKIAIDISGNTYGRLTVIKFMYKNKDRMYFWLCRCKCGKETIVSVGALKSGRTQSCGCHCRERSSEASWLGFEKMSGCYLSKIRQSAKDRQINFNITNEDIWNQYIKQDRKCAISGIEIEFRRNRKEEQTASLDRINSNYGYEIDNIQLVHKDINIMKGNLTTKELLYWADLITNPISTDSNTQIIADHKKSKLFKGFGEWSLTNYSMYKNSAIKRGYEFNLSIEDGWYLFLKQNKRCKVTNVPIAMTTEKYKQYHTASLDRINNNIGYVLENVRWTHKIVNKMKWDLCNNEFIKYCSIIYLHNKKRQYDINMIGGHH